jgi:hypothetical protein
MPKQLPAPTVSSDRTLQARVIHGLDPATATDEQIAAAANLLYRIVAGNGLIERGETIQTQIGILSARHVGFTFQVTKTETGYLLIPQPLNSAQPSTHDAMMAGMFMGALRAIGKMPRTQSGTYSDNQRNTSVIIGFETKKQLVKALNALAEQFPEVSLLSGQEKPRSALDLITEITTMIEKDGSPPSRG